MKVEDVTPASRSSASKHAHVSLVEWLSTFSADTSRRWRPPAALIGRFVCRRVQIEGLIDTHVEQLLLPINGIEDRTRQACPQDIHAEFLPDRSASTSNRRPSAGPTRYVTSTSGLPSRDLRDRPRRQLAIEGGDDLLIDNFVVGRLTRHKRVGPNLGQRRRIHDIDRDSILRGLRRELARNAT